MFCVVKYWPKLNIIFGTKTGLSMIEYVCQIYLLGISHAFLTHFGLVMSYGDIYMGRHWLQAITWTNVDLS